MKIVIKRTCKLWIVAKGMPHFDFWTLTKLFNAGMPTFCFICNLLIGNCISLTFYKLPVLWLTILTVCIVMVYFLFIKFYSYWNNRKVLKRSEHPRKGLLGNIWCNIPRNVLLLKLKENVSYLLCQSFKAWTCSLKINNAI